MKEFVPRKSRYVRKRDFSRDKKLAIREADRHAFVRRVMDGLTQKPEPHQLFCEMYHNAISLLSVGNDRKTLGENGNHDCSVMWMEDAYPKLLKIIESHVKKEILRAGRDQTYKGRHEDEKDHLEWCFIPFIQSLKFSRDEYLSLDPSNDNIAKVYEETIVAES